MSAEVCRISSVIVTARTLFGEALAESLNRMTSDILVDHVCATISSAMERMSSRHPRVVIALVELGQNDALVLLKRTKRCASSAGTIVVDERANPLTAREAVRLGAAGYLTIGHGLSVLIDSIRSVAAGGVAIPSDISSLFRRNTESGLLTETDGDLCLLTGREIDVLKCVALGDTVREAAMRLGIAESTVDNHKTRIMRKLNVHRSVDLVKFAIRARLVSY